MLETRTFAAWLERDVRLTPIQTRILAVLGHQFGAWVPGELIRQSIWYEPDDDASLAAADQHALRSHLVRLRRKLAGTPWSIESRYRHGCYRLVRD